MSRAVMTCCLFLATTTLIAAADDARPAVQSAAYGSARHAVHERAALKATQRQQRIAARKWLGYSPLRPSVSSVPAMGGPQGWVAPRRFGLLARISFLQAKHDPGPRIGKSTKLGDVASTSDDR